MRQWIKLVETASEQEMLAHFPRELSEQELLAYAYEHAGDDPADISTAIMDEMFGGYTAELRLVPIEGAKFNGGVGSDRKMKRYAKLKTIAPPIIMRRREIVDGNHRVRAALKNGETHIWAYVMIDTMGPI